MKHYKVVLVLLAVLFMSTAVYAQTYDLDIPDDLGNLVGNTMSMNLAPGNYGVGQFWLVNPDASNNVDPDPYGTEDLTEIYVELFELVHISNPLAWIPVSNISVDLTQPYSLDNGDAVLVNLMVDVPFDQVEGTYEAAVVVHDSTEDVTDTFKLRVTVGPQEDVDIVEDVISTTAGAADTLVLIGMFTVINPDTSYNPDPDGPSNTDLYNMRFAAQNFLDTLHPTRHIPSEEIYIAVTGVFGPTPVTEAGINQLALGDTATIEVWVHLPYGTHAGTYNSQIMIYDDDGWPSDAIGLGLTIDPSYDLDISDNTGNLVGNWMTLSSGPGTIPSGHFILINPNTPGLNVDPDIYGNADLNNISYTIDDLVHITNPLAWIDDIYITLSITPLYSLASGASEIVSLSVDIPFDQVEGEYTAWVRVIDDTVGVGDSFQLRVVVGLQEDIDIVETNISNTAGAGDTLVYLGRFTVINPDTTWNPDPDGPSNTELYNIRFAAEHLRDTMQPTRFIPSEQVYVAVTGVFGPTPVHLASLGQLALGDTAICEVWVHLPYGTHAGAYKGQVQVQDDDGWPSDVVGLLLTVETSYDLDISDNTGNLVGNWMSFSSLPGTSPLGHFILINPNTPELNVDPDIFGNADLNYITYTIDDLVHITNPLAWMDDSYISLSITPPYTLISGGSEIVSLTVNIPPDQIEGEYTTWVRLIDTVALVGDSFQLRVIVGPQEDIDIVETNVLGSAMPGDTMVFLNRFTVVNPDTSWNPDPDGPSNAELYNVRFAAENLRDTMQPTRFIPSEQVYIAVTGVFGPTPVYEASLGQLALGDTAICEVWAYIPYGTRAAAYKGQIQVQDDDGWPSDVVGLLLDIGSMYDLDISDNEQNLVENTMHLSGAMGSTQESYFRLINPNTAELNVDPDIYGNADFTSLSYTLDTLWYVPFGAEDISYFINPSNVSINLPTSLTNGSAEDVLVSVAIPNDVFAGTYRGTVTVTGTPGTPGTPTDMFTLEVFVGGVDDIDITEASVSESGDQGTTVTTGNFTVWSTDATNNPDPDGPGNTTLYGVNFIVEDLRDATSTYVIPANNISFVPSLIDSIQAGTSKTVYAMVNIPFGTYATTYTGLATATNNTATTNDTVRIIVTVNSYYDLDISDYEQALVGNKMHLAGAMGSTHSGYFRMINPANPEQNVDPDQYGNADFTSFTATVDTLWYIPFGSEEVLYYIPPSAVTVTLPAGLMWGTSYDAMVSVNIPTNTFTGIYRGNVTVTGTPGTPGTPTDMFTLEVFVGGVDDIDITEPSASAIGNMHTVVNTSPFTVWSTDVANNPDPDGPGNTTLYGVHFTCSDLRDQYNLVTIPASNISFVPALIDSIQSGTSNSVYARVYIPLGTYATTYTGLATATNNTGTTSDTIRIIVSVFPYYDLDIADNQENLVENKMRLSGAMGSTNDGYFRMVNPALESQNVDPDVYGNADFASFTAVVETLWYVPFGGEDINYFIPKEVITITLPGSLMWGTSYDAQIQVAIPMNTFSGIYRGNVTVTGTPGTPGTPTDLFTLEVFVGGVDDIDITEASVTGTGDHGTTVNTTNFTVWSTDAANNPDPDGPGNTTLYGVNFIVEDLRDATSTYIIPASNVSFVPSLIDSIQPGTSKTVYAMVNVPFGTYATTYTGLATATNNTGTTNDTVRLVVTVNPYYDLDIADNEQTLVGNILHLSGAMGAVPNGYFRMINPNTAELNVDPDQYGNADFTSFTATVETLRYIPFGGEEVLYYIPPSVVTITLPSGLASGGSYNAFVSVDIPMNTFTGIYQGTVTVTGTPGTPGTPTDMFTLEVYVGGVDDIDITEASVSGTGDHGTTASTGLFTVWSADSLSNPDPDGPGNTTLYGVTFTSEDLRAGSLIIPSSNVSFVPSFIDSIKSGTSITAFARVNVPYGTYATTYSGLATATNNTGTTDDTVRIYVTVLPSYDIDISDNTQNLVGNWMTLSSLPGTYVEGYFMTINPNSAELNVDPDQFGNADLHYISWSVEDLIHITDPLAYIPQDSVNLSITWPHTILSGGSEQITLTVHIPQDQFEGEYTAWVREFDTQVLVRDSFQLRVIVGPVEDVDIVENSIYNSVTTGDTLVYIGTYTVINPDASYNPDPDGPANIDLYNLRFACENLRDTAYPIRYINSEQVYVAVTGQFGPTPLNLANIAQLALGDTAMVEVWANIPRGTHTATYRGQMTVIDDDGWPSDVITVMIHVQPYYDLDIADNEQNLTNNIMHLAGAMGSTHSGYFRMLNPNNANLNVDPDVYGNAPFSSFTPTVETLRYIPFGGEDINYFIPPSAVTITLPSGLASGASYNANVQVAIPMNTFSGVYRGTVTIAGTPVTPGTPTDVFTLEVSVGPVDDIDITEASVTATTNHGTIVNTTNFTVWSTDAANNPDPDGPGNTTLYGVTFSAQDLRDATGNLSIPASNVSFVPSFIDSIQPGTSKTVYARVFVPFGTFATTYSGLATAMNSSGTTSDTVRIVVTVNPYYDLDIADNVQNLVSNKMHLSGAMGSTHQGYFRMINPNALETNVDPDQFGNANFTSFTATVETLRYIPFGGEDINYFILPSAVTFTLPTGLNSGYHYDARVQVIIPMNTFTGIYQGAVTITGTPGTPGTPTDVFTLEVFVGGVDDLDIDSTVVHASGAHGTAVTTTRFNVYSTDATVNPDPDGPGNTTLYGITFSSQDLRDATGNRIISAANISFIPSLIDSIRPGASRAVYARVNIPFGTFATAYSGLATATNRTGTTFDTVRIIVIVSPYYDLDIADNEQNLTNNKMSLSGAMGSTRTGLFRMVNPNSADLNVDPDQFGNANFTSFSATVETLRYIPFGSEEINYFIPPTAVTITLPEGLAAGASYNALVSVNIPMNTYSGVYRGNVGVTGTPLTPGTPTDVWTLEVFVGGVDDLDIDSTAVHASGGHGTMATTTTFRVYSTDAAANPDPDGPGNTTLYGITFIASDLRAGARVIPVANIQFVPGSIDSIRPGANRAVYARVNVPYSTFAQTYSGPAIAINNTGSTSDTVLIVVTVTPSYDLDIADNQQNLTSNKMTLSGPMGAIREGRFRMVNPNIPELNIDPDMYGNADFTSFTYRVDTLRYIPTGGEEILTYIPPSAVTFLDNPTSLASGASANPRVQVTIPFNTFAGTYQGTVTVTGTPLTPGTPTDVFTLEVIVGVQEDLDITEASVSASGDQGTTIQTSNFQVWSTDVTHNPDPDPASNVTLYGINFIATDLRYSNRVIPASNIQFMPTLIESLYPGTSASVYARVNIPYGTFAATYSGLVTAQNNTGSTSDTVRIYVTVNPDYDLDIADNMANLVTNKVTLRLIPNRTASGQFLLVNPDRNENNYDPDPYGNSDLTRIRYVVSDVLTSNDGYSLAGSAISFSNIAEGLIWGASQYVTVTASIEQSQPYATYYGTVTVLDTVGEGTIISDNFMLEVVVGPLDAFSMPDTIFINGYAGEFGTDTFYIENTGNKTIDRIEIFAMTDFFNKPGGVRIPKENMQFTPPILVDSMVIGESRMVTCRVEIPKATLPTRYIAKAKAMQQRGDPAKNFVVVLYVKYRINIDEGIVVSDNPVTGPYVDIGYWGEMGKPVKLTIMNMAAEIVHTKELALDEGMNSGVYRWYLKNDKEKEVASGLYVIITQFTTTEEGKSVDKVFTKKILVVK